MPGASHNGPFHLHTSRLTQDTHRFRPLAHTLKKTLEVCPASCGPRRRRARARNWGEAGTKISLTKSISPPPFMSDPSAHRKRAAALKWLELDVGAASVTVEEVNVAYRRLAKLYHPDKNGGSAEAVARYRQAWRRCRCCCWGVADCHVLFVVASAAVEMAVVGWV